MATHTNILLADLKGYDRREQLKACRKYLKANSLPPVGRRVYEHNEVEKLLDNVQESDIVIVPRLDAFKAYKGRGIGNRLLLNVLQAVSIVEAVHDISKPLISTQNGWTAHVDKAANRVAKSRGLTSTEASRRAAMRDHEGIVRKWKEMKGTKAYKSSALVWGNMSISPERKAISMMNKELRALSPSTIRRIFKSRTECGQWLNNN